MARKKVEKQTVSNNFDGLLELMAVKEELKAEEFKKKYKNAAAKHHPDKNPGTKRMQDNVSTF